MLSEHYLIVNPCPDVWDDSIITFIIKEKKLIFVEIKTFARVGYVTFQTEQPSLS